MAKLEKVESVNFEVLETHLDEIKVILDRFRNGEFMTKKESRNFVTLYRQKLSALGKMLPGARKFAQEAKAAMVPRHMLKTDGEQNHNEAVIKEHELKKLDMGTEES